MHKLQYFIFVLNLLLHYFKYVFLAFLFFFFIRHAMKFEIDFDLYVEYIISEYNTYHSWWQWMRHANKTPSAVVRTVG